MELDKQTILHKVLRYFLVKIIIGIVIIVGLVAIVEGLGHALLDKTPFSNNTKDMIVAFVEAALAVCGYVVLFQVYEKRHIQELSARGFIKNASLGFIIGLLLQTIFIAFIYIAGTYSIIHVNAMSTLITPFTFALTAGFVAEILIIGVLFRLLEQQFGTLLTLLMFVILFALLHINSKGSTALSVAATAIQAGFMLPAAFVFSRSLWLPIFLHFGWDFAEPGIFGGINPSTSFTQGLLSSKIAGSTLLTGGQTGPQNAVQSLLICLLTGALFLWISKQKGYFIRPKWLKHKLLPTAA
jgi:membrane protease YdiL (CAAX protease family)